MMVNTDVLLTAAAVRLSFIAHSQAIILIVFVLQRIVSQSTISGASTKQKASTHR